MARFTHVSSASIDLLINAYTDMMLRSHEDTRAGREELYQKLESTGYDIGKRFAERMMRDKERLVETLDVVKWVCRDFWSEVFRKSVDKLQTNNMGIFALQDHSFRWTRYTSGSAADDNKALMLKYTILPCGLIRGAFAAFDLDVTVNVDVSSLPKAFFTIKIKGSS